MNAEYNKQLVEDMYVALNTKNLDAHDLYWHKDMIWHGPPGFGDIHGLENFKEQVMKPFYAAFPDYYVKNDIVVADAWWKRDLNTFLNDRLDFVLLNLAV